MQVVVRINQPEVGRGAMTAAQLETMHAAMNEKLVEERKDVSTLCYWPARRSCP
jgi:histidinol phosphatase-like enzyme